MTHKETVIVSLHTDDGLVGYGESSPLPDGLYTQEDAATCFAVQQKVAPHIVGKHFATAEDFRQAYAAATLDSPFAQNGLECAFWHLLAQQRGVSLKQLLGGERQEIAVGESIGIGASTEATLEEITLRLNEGYARIKVKIQPGWDVEILRAVRARWPHIDLSADANAAYNFHEHAALLRSFDTFGLSMLEQPFGTDELEAHARLQAGMQTPICLDESLVSAAVLAEAIRLTACKVVNIKPGRVGGLCESLKMCELAAANGIGVWCGGMFETGIGRAFNIALASRKEFAYPADMSPYHLYFAEDLVEPSFVVKPNGHIDVPSAPGLGFNVRLDRIEKYTVEKAVVGA